MAIEYALLSEAYNGEYEKIAILNKNKASEAFSENASKTPAELPSYSKQDFSKLNIVAGDKLRIKNGVLLVDKRNGFKRFLTRDGRTKTLNFLEKNRKKMSYNILYYIIHCLQETYKNDKKWLDKSFLLLEACE